MALPKRKTTVNYDELLLCKLDEALSDLRSARSRFMFACDEEEITAVIFEINSLNAHCSKILREIRERGIKREPFYYLKREK